MSARVHPQASGRALAASAAGTKSGRNLFKRQLTQREFALEQEHRRLDLFEYLALSRVHGGRPGGRRALARCGVAMCSGGIGSEHDDIFSYERKAVLCATLLCATLLCAAEEERGEV